MTYLNLRISIIFPSYNGENYLIRNLDSIKRLNNLNEIELVIIDNNSNDSSIEIIESYKKNIQIKLIKGNTNLGFSKACNIGALNAEGEFIFITNQDVIFPPEFFSKLNSIYNNLKKEEEVILSPAIVFENHTIHYFGAKNHFLGFSYTPSLGQKLPKEKIVKTTKRISGGSLFIKKSLFLKKGAFDSHFFMYYEDTDFSLRILRNGLKMYTTNDPFLIHQKEEWTISNFRYYLLERNRFFLLIKNINNLKKLFPFLLISEIVLIFQSVLIKKFKLRLTLYAELINKRKFFKNLREKSKEEIALFPYEKLSKTLDPVLLGDLGQVKAFNTFLKIFNSFLKLI